VRRYTENSQNYTVILMDCQMPILDGYAATRAIREWEEENSVPRVPVIGLTAFAMAGDREKCIEAGMDNYTTKPVGKMELLRTVATWAKKSAKTRKMVPMNLKKKSEADKEVNNELINQEHFNASIVTRDASMINFLGKSSKSAMGGSSDAKDVMSKSLGVEYSDSPSRGGSR
jgi:DNA-binding response OmpR family regulator